MTQGTDHSRLRRTAAPFGVAPSRSSRRTTSSAGLVVAARLGGCLSAGSIGSEGATSTSTGESCPLYPLHACVPWYDDPKDIPPSLGNVGVCAVPP